eukprot:TRINITY_DN5930_c0_g1_i1.p1 TRINITY_DN5930_c0_g1~~TRINITY_DN5930_c0_g1_i1.p1  ORF type:complete len:138 (+),score=25.40 TRINITY_DN5930_c0_g1_i1:252-665(+)
MFAGKYINMIGRQRSFLPLTRLTARRYKTDVTKDESLFQILLTAAGQNASTRRALFEAHAKKQYHGSLTERIELFHKLGQFNNAISALKAATSKEIEELPTPLLQSLAKDLVDIRRASDANHVKSLLTSRTNIQSTQ